MGIHDDRIETCLLFTPFLINGCCHYITLVWSYYAYLKHEVNHICHMHLFKHEVKIYKVIKGFKIILMSIL